MCNLFLVLLLLYLYPVLATNPSPLTSATGILKINCGGPAIGDVKADNIAFHSETANARSYSRGDKTKSIFTTQSFNKNLVYTFTVTPGAEIRIVAHFAEIWPPAQKQDPRIIDVYINNEPMRTNLNVFNETGALFAPMDISHVFIATTGVAEVGVTGKKQNAMLSGVDVFAPGLIIGGGKLIATPVQEPSVLRSEPSTNTESARLNPTAIPILEQQRDVSNTITSIEFVRNPLSLFVNCGGPAIGSKIVADSPTYYGNTKHGIGIRTAGAATSSIANTQAYGKEKEDLVYTFNVTRGADVSVEAYFAEINSTFASIGARIIDVEIGGELVENDLDVFSKTNELFKLYQVKRAFKSEKIAVEVRIKSKKGNPILNGVRIEHSGGSKKQDLAELESALPHGQPVAIPIDPNYIAEIVVDKSNL